MKAQEDQSDDMGMRLVNIKQGSCHMWVNTETAWTIDVIFGGISVAPKASFLTENNNRMLPRFRFCT